MTRARDIADLGQDKSTLASYVDTGVTSTDLERIDITTEGTSEASKVVTADSSGHVTLAGELRGPATLIIDPAVVGDNTGLLQVKGNLQVDGTTTTINSTTVEVDDKNIVLGSGAADSAAADGAGLTIDGASATMLYTHSTTSFDFNKPINVTGNASVSGDLTVDTNTLKVDSSGNKVGVGTASPTVALEIKDTGNQETVAGFGANDNGTAFISVRTAETQNNTAGVSFETGTTTPTGVSSSTTLGYMLGKVMNSSGALQGELQFWTNDGDSLTQRMAITEAGKVGIGQTNPTASLHVHKSAGTSVYITTDSDTNNSAHTALWLAHNYSTNADWAGIVFDADNKLRINNSGSGNDSHLVVNDSGNIGIGTDNPIADLSIVDPTTNSGIEIQPEVTTNTNRITNYDRVENAYKKFRLEAETIEFNISGAEKMRINSTGGISFPNDTELICWQNSNELNLTRNWNSGQSTLYFSYKNGSNSQNGNTYNKIAFYGGVSNLRPTIEGGAYSNASDYRLKENVNSITESVINKIKNLNPVTFDWKSGDEQTQVGFIAHEVDEVFPLVVTGEKDAMSEKDPDSIEAQCMIMGHLTTYLTKGMQELITRVEALEAAS